MISVRWRDLIPSDEASWSVLWDMRATADPARCNVALAGSEAEAMERTAHFVALGFHVLCVKAPSGAVLLDQRAVAARFKHRAPDTAAAGAE